MKIKLQRDVWRIELPEELVKETGFSEGEQLECRAFPGGLSLLSRNAAATGAAKLHSQAGKNFAAGAQALLLWFFPFSAGRGGFAPEKRKSQGTAGSAGL